ncbi:MAG TPA: penicillin-binding protein 2 [Jiangellales bacterium]|nr:penicillin-binding protein 2 [Jiangellales bacterium]
MNTPLRRVSVGFMLLFFALLANVTYVQAFQADELNGRQDNRRVVLDEYSRERGPILVAETPVARSVSTEDEFEYLRQYPEGPLYAHATGYYSFLFGRAAMERAENDVLAGTDDRLFVRRLVDLVTGREARGGSVKLTLDPSAQRAAYDGLGSQKGAVVAIDTTTGALLAMASTPTYDPNPLASHSVTEQQEAWDSLTNDPDRPMLNRAIAQTLPPGSVFKIVTSAAALESGRYTPDSVIPGPAEYQLPQSTRTLPNQSGQPCGPGGETTLTNALRISCNTAFAYLGNDLGDDALREQAERFGYNSQPLPEMNAATSVFPDDLDAPQTALSAIGQFDVRATPLEIAMTSAAVANRGVLMRPYLVEEILGPDLAVIDQTQPSELSRAMSAETARDLTAMMVDVVENGTGGNAAIPGVPVAGKTGTAQSSADRPPYAWFTSFAPADDPRVAVAVVIEEAGENTDISGGRLAAPVARAVMEAVLGS